MEHGNAKLTYVDVAFIRELKIFHSSKEVAKMYAVGKQTILDIWQGKTWRKER